MKILFYILRLFLVGLCLLFLWNGIKITFRGEDILFVSGALFRYAFLCDILYFFFEILFPFLYKKFSKLMFSLFPIKKSKIYMSNYYEDED